MVLTIVRFVPGSLGNNRSYPLILQTSIFTLVQQSAILRFLWGVESLPPPPVSDSRSYFNMNDYLKSSLLSGWSGPAPNSTAASRLPAAAGHWSSRSSLRIEVGVMTRRDWTGAPWWRGGAVRTDRSGQPTSELSRAASRSVTLCGIPRCSHGLRHTA